jgi:hypothetical protein
VPRDLRLVRPDDLDGEADAHFVIAHQIDESQTRAVRKRAEKQLLVELRRWTIHFGQSLAWLKYAP